MMSTHQAGTANKLGEKGGGFFTARNSRPESLKTSVYSATGSNWNPVNISGIDGISRQSSKRMNTLKFNQNKRRELGLATLNKNEAISLLSGPD